MPDYKFHAASFDLKGTKRAIKQIKHDEIKKVFRQFAENIARSRGIMDFIHIITHFSTLYERSSHQAMFKFTGHP